MSEAPSDPGTMLKLGFVVLCVGGCALSMLALRQAGLQAGHELAQTQLRIQKSDEDLWRLRAEIATLAAPARIRELADKLGPLHGLTPRNEEAQPGTEISTATGPSIATTPEPVKPKTSGKPAPKPAATKPAEKPAEKPASKPASKPVSSPATKPTSTPKRAPVSPSNTVT